MSYQIRPSYKQKSHINNKFSLFTEKRQFLTTAGFRSFSFRLAGIKIFMLTSSNAQRVKPHWFKRPTFKSKWLFRVLVLINPETTGNWAVRVWCANCSISLKLLTADVKTSVFVQCQALAVNTLVWKHGQSTKKSKKIRDMNFIPTSLLQRRMSVW